MSIFILIVQILSRALTILILAHVFLAYFMDSYHPIWRWLTAVVEPLLMPIRRILPPIAGFDFSPVVLLVLVQILEQILLQLLR